MRSSGILVDLNLSNGLILAMDSITRTPHYGYHSVLQEIRVLPWLDAAAVSRSSS